MKNPDIEIYLRNLINFFTNNPNDLTDLIGKSNMPTFYEKLRKVCEKNYLNGDDIVLTRKQMMDIIYEMKKPKIKQPFQETKYGIICLN
jgi:hypothetical protein